MRLSHETAQSACAQVRAVNLLHVSHLRQLPEEDPEASVTAGVDASRSKDAPDGNDVEEGPPPSKRVRRPRKASSDSLPSAYDPLKVRLRETSLRLLLTCLSCSSPNNQVRSSFCESTIMRVMAPLG